MYRLTHDQLAAARDLLEPERPGPIIAEHAITSGTGEAWADRYPDPRAIAVHITTNGRCTATRRRWTLVVPESLDEGVDVDVLARRVAQIEVAERLLDEL